MARFIDSIKQHSRAPQRSGTNAPPHAQRGSIVADVGDQAEALVAPPAYIKPFKTSEHATRSARLKPRQSAINSPYKTAQQKRRRNWWAIVTMALGVSLLLFFGGLQIIILPLLAAYFAIALWLRLSSKLVYGLALVALLCIPLSQLLQLNDIAENYALYAYLLLIMGTMLLALEVRRSGRFKNFRRS